MADHLTDLEFVRFEHMKVFRVQKLTFADMVPRLHELGLLSCQNCTAGTPKIRVTARGVEVCRTCENSLSVFWKRNITRLKEEEADLIEVRWEWIEGKRHLQRIALERSQQRVVITTTRTEPGTNEKGEAVAVTYTTERVENRIYPDLLRLYDELGDDIARINGLDADDPDALDPTPRSKVTIRLPPGMTLEDLRGDGSEPSN